MVKHTQAIRWLLPTKCLSVLDHFVGLALKGLRKLKWFSILQGQTNSNTIVSSKDTNNIHRLLSRIF